MKEKKIQLLLGDWLKETYPDLIFKIDVADGMRLTIGQAMCAKRMRSAGKHCDLVISKPNSQYHGMFLEIKQSTEKVYTKKSKLRSSKHILCQLNMIARLLTLGYYADWGFGLQDCKDKIISYIDQK